MDYFGLFQKFSGDGSCQSGDQRYNSNNRFRHRHVPKNFPVNHAIETYVADSGAFHSKTFIDVSLYEIEWVLLFAEKD